MTKLGDGCAESVFMLALARDAMEGEVTCTLEWTGQPEPPLYGGLRYAIFAQAVADAAHVPVSYQYHQGAGAAAGAPAPAPAPAVVGKRLAVVVGVSK